MINGLHASSGKKICLLFSTNGFQSIFVRESICEPSPIRIGNTAKMKQFVLRRLFINGLMVIASIAIGLSVVEIGLRLFGYSPAFFSPWAADIWRYDQSLGWFHRESHKSFFEHPLFKVSVEINSKGLRDREHALEKPDDKKRVLILGDSFVWGFGVEADERFSDVVQQEQGNLEVINAGVSGWSTDQELIWLEEKGLSYAPDLVILLLYQNDLTDNLQKLVNNFYYKPVFILEDDESLRLDGTPCPRASAILLAMKNLRNHSSLVSLIGNLTYRSGLDVRRLIFGKSQDKTDSERGIKTTLAILDQVRSLLESRGIGLILMTYCEGNQCCDSLAGLATSKGICCLSIDAIPGYSPDTMTIKNDGHWNSIGHKFVGQALSEYLKSSTCFEKASFSKN